MKNALQILTFVVISIFTSINYSLAQSLELIEFEATVKGTVQGEIEKVHKSHAKVKNISNSEKKVFVRVTPIKLTTGHSFSACVPGACSNESVDAFDTQTFKIQANSIVSEDFYVAVNPKDPVLETEVEGETTLKIDFIVSGSETDLVTYNTTFLLSKASVIETWNKTADVFPNPSTEYVVVRLKEELANTSIIRVYDANGNIMLTSELQSSVTSANISTSSWNAGSYYFTVESDGNIFNSGNFTVVR